MVDHVLSFKGEAKKVKNKIVEYNLNMIAHNRSCFDSYVVLNNLPPWRSVIKITKKRAGIFLIKILIRYVDLVKKTPQFVRFPCGRFHNN